jgi:hypothetical protein
MTATKGTQAAVSGDIVNCREPQQRRSNLKRRAKLPAALRPSGVRVEEGERGLPIDPASLAS